MPGRCREEGWCWVKGRGVLPWVLSAVDTEGKWGPMCSIQFGGHLGCSHHLEAT